MFIQIVVLKCYISLDYTFGIFSIYAVMVHKINMMFLELLGRSHFADPILYKIGPFYLCNTFYKRENSGYIKDGYKQQEGSYNSHRSNRAFAMICVNICMPEWVKQDEIAQTFVFDTNRIRLLCYFLQVLKYRVNNRYYSVSFLMLCSIISAVRE